VGPEPTLLLVVGPIASGKSTVAAALGAHLRHAGRDVAVIDLDDVVDTIGGFVDLTPDHFHLAHVVFGQLARSWLDAGFDVIAHGPLISTEEDDILVHQLADGVRPRRVLLTTTFATALRRVSADPDRMLSDHPEVLEATYDRFHELLPSMRPAEWTFDSTVDDVDAIVTRLGNSLAAG
jgi:Mrp family chromosome partitioning ATPase